MRLEWCGGWGEIEEALGVEARIVRKVEGSRDRVRGGSCARVGEGEEIAAGRIVSRGAAYRVRAGGEDVGKGVDQSYRNVIPGGRLVPGAAPVE